MPPSPQLDLTAPSSHARTAPGSPEVIQAALASPALSLPSPGAFRAAASSPASEVQSEQKTSSALVGGGVATAANEAFSDSEATMQEQLEEFEVYVPSEIWKVFQQAVKQVTYQEPRMLPNLATCRACPVTLEQVILEVLLVRHNTHFQNLLQLQTWLRT